MNKIQPEAIMLFPDFLLVLVNSTTASLARTVRRYNLMHAGSPTVLGVDVH